LPQFQYFVEYPLPLMVKMAMLKAPYLYYLRLQSIARFPAFCQKPSIAAVRKWKYRNRATLRYYAANQAASA
jgi:hypothetical protein